MTLLVQPSFAKGEISPDLAGRVDVAAYHVALATARNVIIRPYGGASNRPGLEYICPIRDMTQTPRLRRFRFNTTDTYMLEFSDLKMRVIRNDAPVLEVAKAITGASKSNPCTITVTAHGWSDGDDVEVAGVLGMTRLNARRFRISAHTTNTITLQDIITGTAIDSTAFTAYISGGTAARVYSVVSPYAQADLSTLKFVQSADVVTITHPGYAIRELSRTAHTSWTFTTPTMAPSIVAPTGIVVTPTTSGSVTRFYAVTAINSANEESVASATGTTTTGAVTSDDVISWTASAGAVRYAVYLYDNGIAFWMGETPNTAFTNSNIAADQTSSPPTARNPFASTGTFPSSSTYYQQRQVYGGSTLAPDTTNYSGTGNFHNFNVSTPVKADEAITATLASREVNQIRHFVPGNDLIIFTAGAEWRVNSGAQSGFASDTIRQSPQSAWGCSHLEPILIGLTILFVPENKRVVRSLAYTYVSDTYTGTDITILSNHLFRDYDILDWASGRSPDPLIYCIRADGVAAVLTFQEEQQVVAWARWDTAGTFEAVDVIRPNDSDPDDVPYFVVKRTVNGSVVRYIERLHSRSFLDVQDAFFVDSGLSYDSPTAIAGVTLGAPVVINAASHPFVNGDEVDVSDIEWVANVDDLDNETQPAQLNGFRYTVAGATTDAFQLAGSDSTGYNAYVSGGNVRKAVSTVSGLDHLEGRTVVALGDGNVVSDLVVTAGAVTLPRKFSRIHVGLRYVSDVETLNIEAPQGTIQGKLKKISSATVRFSKSRGLFIGIAPDDMVEIKQREFEAMGAPTELLTGDKQLTLPSTWESNGRLFMRQRYPLPMNILAVVPDLDAQD